MPSIQGTELWFKAKGFWVPTAESWFIMRHSSNESFPGSFSSAMILLSLFVSVGQDVASFWSQSPADACSGKFSDKGFTKLSKHPILLLHYYYLLRNQMHLSDVMSPSRRFYRASVYSQFIHFERIRCPKIRHCAEQYSCQVWRGQGEQV